MTKLERAEVKAARVAALLYAADAGWLDDPTLTLDAIAKALAGEGVPVNRSTILRNLRNLAEVRDLRNLLIERLRARLPGR